LAYSNFGRGVTRGGLQATLKTENERRGAMAIIETIRVAIADRTPNETTRRELVLALLCWCKDQQLRNKIAEILAVLLECGDISEPDLAPNYYDRKPRRLVQRFLRDTRLIERWTDEQDKRRLEEESRRRERKNREECVQQERENVEQLAHQILEKIRQCFMHMLSSPEVVTPDLNATDLRLIAKWANIGLHDPEPNAHSLRAVFGDDYNFSRLYSARAAELAAANYYSKNSKSVVDVAAQQLDKDGAEWQTHDLLVDAKPVDIKCARQSAVNPERFSAYLVPGFKMARSSNIGVSIAAVLNAPYRTADAILSGTSSKSLIVGEVRSEDFSMLKRWFVEKFRDTLDIEGMTVDKRLPGWCFDYGWKSDTDDRQMNDRILDLREMTQTFPWLDERITIPLPVFARVRDFHQSDRDELDCDEDLDAIELLRSMHKGVGLTRRSLFLFVLAVTLRNIRRPTSSWRPLNLLRVLFWPLHRDTKRWPAGVYDPLKYVHEIIRGMDQLWLSSREELRYFKSFRISGPSILIGIDERGRRRTLMAYCGGWIERGRARMPCGQSPLILGRNSGCDRCRRLVCESCGHCSETCPNAQRDAPA